MGWILRMDLPALRENIQNVAALVFKLLHKYAAAGLSKGDNFDLVVAAFKVSFTQIFQQNTYCSKTRLTGGLCNSGLLCSMCW
jgi:hypothetical protein